MAQKTKDFLAVISPKYSYTYEKRGDTKIKYLKIHFNYGGYHFKLKLRGSPYPLVEDHICDLVKGDRKFAELVCDTFFSGLQAMANEKKDPFVLVVSTQRQAKENKKIEDVLDLPPGMTLYNYVAPQDRGKIYEGPESGGFIEALEEIDQGTIPGAETNGHDGGQQ